MPGIRKGCVAVFGRADAAREVAKGGREALDMPDLEHHTLPRSPGDQAAPGFAPAGDGREASRRTSCSLGARRFHWSFASEKRRLPIRA